MPDSDDDTPVSFDDDEEERMERLLDDTEYDAELGVEMAKDAQRVAAGELSEAAFYRRYHEDVLEEFGEDDRELTGLLDDAGGEGFGDRLSGLADDEDLSRREVLKKGGAAAVALGLFASVDDGTAAAQQGDDEDGPRYGMTINLNNCDAVSPASSRATRNTARPRARTGCTCSRTRTTTRATRTSSCGRASTARTPRVRRCVRSAPATPARRTASC
ncbi:4Fe-4S ferredoxin N-terminal domain-containing protein [Halobacterium sp. CBA1126]|uniref:4Fe-4S ferredoxin N-terminal domain-containing protein n=1 Tax=Halobacterium sp. CBA1126 TaxID=2668074 RepID=UPI0018D24F0F